MNVDSAVETQLASRPRKLRLRMKLYGAFILGFNAVLLDWLVFNVGGHQTVVTVDNIAQFLGPMLVLPLCLPALRRAGRLRMSEAAAVGWTPLLIGASIVCWSVGQIIWAYYELILKQASPFPSMADVFFMAQYPLLTAGVLAIPRRPLSGVARTRLALDGLIIMTAVVTFSWYFILGPTVNQGGETPLAKFLGTSYPLWDVVLIGSLLVLFAHGRDRATRRIIALFAAGLVLFVASDSYFDYANLQNTYATGSLFDVGWPCACMIFALAAYAVRVDRSSRQVLHAEMTQKEQIGTSWGSIVPYAVVPAVFGLLLYVLHVTHDSFLRTGVEVGAGVLMTLVVSRQIIAIEENRQLSRRLQANNAELAAANTRLEALATTDPHTDLPNHRAIVASLDHELERAFRYYRPCSILFVDLDHFKILNDGYGHQAGDSALSDLARVMRGALRGIDLVGRWGGEEFVAILPETDSATAAGAAERLRASVAAHEFGADRSTHLTCSIGIASYPEDGTDRDELIGRADHAMYAAKHLGRNQVRRASDALPATLAGSRLFGRHAYSPTSAVEALASLVDARDLYTGEHSSEVGRLSMHVALALGLSAGEAHTIGLAGRLHDIGKIAVPDAVLSKPARLTDDEWKLIRRHPIVGADVLARLPELAPLAPIVRNHHEWWDGRGYPDGLRGDNIPVAARIVGAVDAYSAITTDRPYRASMTPERALAELRLGSGSQFDPTVVEALEQVLVLESTAQVRTA